MYSKKKLTFAAAFAGTVFSVNVGFAEDIDIYAGDNGPDADPNVLIIIDNSANWADNAQHFPGVFQGEAELNAVRTVASEMGADVKIGLMLFTEGSTANNPNGPGGYVRFHMSSMDANNKAGLTSLIGNPAGCTAGPNSVNGTPNCIYQNFNTSTEKVGTAKVDYSAMMFEAYKYLGGHTSPALALLGTNNGGTPVSASQFGPLRYSGAPDPKSDPAAYTGDALKAGYNSPITDAGSCAKNYIIFIGNGFPTQDSPASLLAGVGGDTSQLNLPNFTVGTGTAETDILEVTACGTYDSIAACEADAAVRYASSDPDVPDPYDSYTCEVASTCGANEETTSYTNFGNSVCGVYADQTACLTGLETDQPGFDGYICEANASCSYTETLSPPIELSSHTDPEDDCLPAANQSSCVLAAAIKWDDYASFSCTDSSNSGCSGGSKRWTVTAAERVVPGQTFTLSASTTTTTDSASTSYRIKGHYTSGGVTATGTSAPPADNKIRYADEWARFLRQTDVSPVAGQQNVRTYTIDVFKDQQDADQTALLMSMARAGGGKYYAANDENSIKNALRKIMSEIQSVNSVFASSSLPVSVNTQGTYLNQVFIGMFRPQGNAEPRWAGNLKQYEFKFCDDSTMKLSDKKGDPAISATTGFISTCADSVWSTDSGDYWDFGASAAVGSCTAESSRFTDNSSSAYSDAPDGDVVEKGGAAQRLRGVGSAETGPVTASSDNYLTRNLLTCLTCSEGATPTPFKAYEDDEMTQTAITAADLGLTLPDAEPTEADIVNRRLLIDWVRGQDVDDENDNGDIYEMRPSVHGGVIHSQPAVVDFGNAGGVIAFYGGDDGVFRAVDGGKTDTEGNELWGFIAPETFSRLMRLRDNSPLVSYPDGSDPGAEPKDYFFDGSIGVYQKPGTAVWLFPTMRRGGRAIYAFDVTTTPVSPHTPTLMWRRGCFTSSVADDSSCSAGNGGYTWTDIGQTWSKPRIAYLRSYVDGDGNPKPILVFGGGYDTCEDTNSTTRCSGTRKGANIWFVDAASGTIIHKYATDYSVPGEVAVLVDSAGYATYAYATDTGGNIYRVNVGSYDGETLSDWTAGTTAASTKIASLGDGVRKFLFGPDVFAYRGYNAVLAGSGDRESPLLNDYSCHNYGGLVDGATGTGVTNRFFMVKDSSVPAYPVDGGGVRREIVYANLTDVTDLDPDNPLDSDDISADGWVFDLAQCEQVVNQPLTFGGVVYFGTNQPATEFAPCSTNLGTARGYSVRFLTGNPAVGGDEDNRYITYVGGGLPPSPVAGVVDVDGVKQPFIIGGSQAEDEDGGVAGGDGNSALGGMPVDINPSASRSRIYWYKSVD